LRTLLRVGSMSAASFLKREDGVKRISMHFEWKSKVSRLLLFALACAPVANCQAAFPSGIPANNSAVSASAPTTSQPTATHPKAPVLSIGVGDLLKVGVFGIPDSDQQVRVGSEGYISLNFINSVHVAGLTTAQAQLMIAEKLKAGGFFTDPQVSVFVMEYATQGVSVLGEVLKPGVYPLLGPRRMFDVLSLAGGTTPKAGKTVTITHRDDPADSMTLSLEKDLTKDTESNVEVFPGDTIVVSKAGVVYVVGDVHKPSGVVMESGTELTVLKAIAMAEGTNPTASLNKAQLLRETPAGRQEIPLRLKDILAAKSPDLRLQAEDILFVPSSAAKSAGRRTLEAIAQASTGLAWRTW